MPKRDIQKSFYKYHQPVDFRNTWRIFKIMSEFVEGYHLLSGLKREVTFFGSARAKPSSRHYRETEKLAKILGKNGHAIITGGGPGIMEAANKGAAAVGAESIGLNIQLPSEQILNPYCKKSQGFYYFFTRKVMLTSPSQAFFFLPGGFGTLDEFFEVIDLIEINRMPPVPVVAMMSDFWKELYNFLSEYSLKRIGAIKPKNLECIHIVDTAEEAAEFARGVKERPFFGDINPTGNPSNIDWKVFRIMAELVEGFEFVNRLKNDVTILGTGKLGPGTPYYQAAEELGRVLGHDGYTIVTGGGPGIMEAANKGAFEAGADSVGLNISFDGTVRANPYVKRSMGFFFPFTRKLIITAPSLAFVCFPGGFGTLHQLFELLVLMQTGKMGRMPIILFGREFWKPLADYLGRVACRLYSALDPGDLKLFDIVDSVEEAVLIIKKVPKTKS
ncbi:MAG: TIGR00730 family Rossman fold protein [Patescibacteria group bacterium]|nr:TIGR00730 family Rossman fold protein [Patescibacteria group bacterium]